MGTVNVMVGPRPIVGWSLIVILDAEEGLGERTCFHRPKKDISPVNQYIKAEPNNKIPELNCT